MNLVDVTKHLCQLAREEYGSPNATTSYNETFAVEQFFGILKTLENSDFSPLYTYQFLEFSTEFDEINDSEQSSDENDENQDVKFRRSITVEEINKIVDWVDKDLNYSSSTILHKFRKVRSMNYVPRFRKHIERDGKRIEKLQQIKEFMLGEFYIKRQIEKVTRHDRRLKPFSIQETRELGWHDFNGSI